MEISKAYLGTHLVHETPSIVIPSSDAYWNYNSYDTSSGIWTDEQMGLEMQIQNKDDSNTLYSVPVTDKALQITNNMRLSCAVPVALNANVDFTFEMYATLGSYTSGNESIIAFTSIWNWWNGVCIYRSSENQMKIDFANEVDSLYADCPNDGKRHHFVFMRDCTNSTYKVYVDGVLNATRTGIGSISKGSISCVWQEGSTMINTNIQQMKAYLRTLTDEEVANLYKSLK